VFVEFFLLLRARKIPVALTEWLTLTEALSRGMALSSLSAFYSLARATLVKSEAYFDQYDQAFQEAFQGVETPAEIHDEVWKWLEDGAHLSGLTESERAALEAGFAGLDLAELRRLFEERLREQEEAHHGGSHWIGTGGRSPFGHSGFHPGGLRIGGESMGRSAVKVAAERRYRGYRTDAAVGVRQLETALRRLRQLSSKNEGPLDELDLDGTINKTADHAGALSLVWRRPRRNQTRVLLLMDAGGSMHAHIGACNRLFTAVDRATHLKDLRRYYFHNCVYDDLYLDATCHPRNSIPTARVLQELSPDYKVVIVGDASMAPSELLEPNGIIWWSASNDEPGIEWLRRINRHFHRVVWLNPVSERSWESIYGRDTIAIVRSIFPMFELTVDGFTAAVRNLMVRR